MITRKATGKTIIPILLVRTIRSNVLARYEYQVRLIDADSPVLTRAYSVSFNIDDLIRDFLRMFFSKCEYTFISKVADTKYYMLH